MVCVASSHDAPPAAAVATKARRVLRELTGTLVARALALEVQTRVVPRIAWAGLILVLLAAVALVGVPIYLLWPFKPQGPSFVPWAWTLRREWAPAGTAVLAAILVGGLYAGWKRTRWPGKTALSLMAMVGVAVAWFAHQNHFEWMFNPIAAPKFDVGAKAPAVDPDDLVLGVVIKDDAVAFPVRRIGYHHVVNVTIGGEPIVASYCTLCHTARSSSGR